MCILNKVVRATMRGIKLEADPRHTALVVKELDLEGSKISAVFGSKEEVKRLSGEPKAQTTSTTPTSRNSQAGIAVEKEVNSIDDVRKSTPDSKWDIR